MQVFNTLLRMAEKNQRCNLRQCRDSGKGQAMNKQHEVRQAKARRENQKRDQNQKNNQ